MYYIRLCEAGGSICFLAASFFIYWSMQPNKCSCFTHTQTHLDCRTAHTLICFAHKQCVSKKKPQPDSHACFLLMHTHTHAQTHTRISGDGVAFGHYKMLTQSLFHTFTDSNCHLDPSGGFGHQKRTRTHSISQTHSLHVHACMQKQICMHAKTNMHVHSSVTEIKSVGAL